MTDDFTKISPYVPLTSDRLKSTSHHAIDLFCVNALSSFAALNTLSKLTKMFYRIVLSLLGSVYNEVNTQKRC